MFEGVEVTLTQAKGAETGPDTIPCEPGTPPPPLTRSSAEAALRTLLLGRGGPTFGTGLMGN